MIKQFRKTSQCAKILQYLKDGNTLTCEQCRDMKWGSNLRSRVSNLKDAGYNIVSEMVKFDGGFVARYRLGVE